MNYDNQLEKSWLFFQIAWAQSCTSYFNSRAEWNSSATKIGENRSKLAQYSVKKVTSKSKIKVYYLL